MHLLVVGAGEMGRWFARDSGAETVAFADRDPAVAREAARAVDGAEAVSPSTDERFQVVCLAVPMRATPAAIAEHASKATGAVVDVAGEMRDSVAALADHAEGLERASFHPLFSAANAPGNLPVVIDRGGPVVDDLCERLSAAGHEVFETTPADHDEAMETVQARAHTAVLAYALAAEEVDPRYHTTLSAPLADLVEQVLGNTPEVYADVQRRFAGGDDIAEAARRLADADAETFVDLYEEAER